MFSMRTLSKKIDLSGFESDLKSDIIYEYVDESRVCLRAQ